MAPSCLGACPAEAARQTAQHPDPTCPAGTLSFHLLTRAAALPALPCLVVSMFMRATQCHPLLSGTGLTGPSSSTSLCVHVCTWVCDSVCLYVCIYLSGKVRVQSVGSPCRRGGQDRGPVQLQGFQNRCGKWACVRSPKSPLLKFPACELPGLTFHP